MPPSRPQIRAFLSSTFSDFLEERSLLVKQVFPALRRKAKDRGVEVVEVDLRWGITEEQSKQGKTIGICLDEIERCRPYFIGLLGDRYGWVPEKTDYRPELLRRQDWLPEHQGNASVTELEILHGVLNNPEMAGQAFFYFRDSAYSDAKAAEGTGWRSKTPEERQKLEALKQRIRDSGFPVVEGLATPEAIAEQIEADLWNLIEEQYPEAVKIDAQALETARHASYRADRTGLYLGGEVYITQLQDWISAGEQRILITGESGAGKSALIANWVAAHERSQPDDVIFCHHLGSSNDASALRPLLARMIDSASTLLVDADELSEPLKVPQDWWELVTQVTNTLSRLSAWAIRHQRRWIWVLDGLDKLALDDQQALPWLPLVLPKGVHLVASALDCPIRTLLQERIYATLTIGPLGEAEREQLIQKYLSLYTKELVPALRQKITSHQQGSSPLFLRVLLEELRLCGKFETLAEQLQGYLAAESVSDLYELVLQRLEEDGHGDAVQKVMTALWASRAGLSENELLDFTGLAPVQWAPIGIGLQEALSEANGRLVFGHDFLRQAVRDRYLPTEEQCRQAHSELANWFEGREGWDERDAEEWPWQLQQAGRISDLRNLLLDVNLLSQLVGDVGCHEVMNYWRVARMVEDGELDELIEETVHMEIEKRKEDEEDLICFVDRIAMLLDDAGLYRELLLQLRLLSLKLEEASPERCEESVLSSLLLVADAQRDIGSYDEAIEIYQSCLRTSEQLLSPEKPWAFKTAASLGGAYVCKGDYSNAEEYLARALEYSKCSIGAEHPDSIALSSNLATVFLETGDIEKAKQLYAEHLEAIRRLKGKDDLGLLTISLNLGVAYSMEGDYERAKELYSFCLNSRMRLLGDYHPETIKALGKLGLLCIQNGSHDQAVIHLTRCLDLSERLLGQDHPDTLDIIDNLAILYREMRDFDRSQEFYARCLSGRERVLGLEHIDTTETRLGMSRLLSEHQYYNESIPLRRRELAIAIRRNGDNSPNVFGSMFLLAEDLYSNNEINEAKQLYKNSLAGLAAISGDESQAAMAARFGLARCLSDLGSNNEAIKYFREILDWIDNQNQSDLFSKTTTAQYLAGSLARNNELQEAIQLFRQALSEILDETGDNDQRAMACRIDIANCLEGLDQMQESIEIRRIVVSWQRKTLGECNGQTLSEMLRLADGLLAIDNWSEAESLYRDFLSAADQSSDANISDVNVARYTLAALLSSQDRFKEAIELRRVELACCQKHDASDKLSIAISLEALADDYFSIGEFIQSEQSYRKALQTRLEIQGDEGSVTMNIRYSLARCLSAMERHSEAIELRRTLFAWFQLTEGEKDLSTLASMHALGCELLSDDQPKEALEMLQQCLNQRSEVLGRSDEATLHTHVRLLEALSVLGRQHEAIGISETLVQELLKDLSLNHPDVLDELSNQASLYLELNQLDTSAKLWRQCLLGREMTLGSDHPETLNTAYKLAEVLSQLGLHQEAIALRRRELAWCRQENGDSDSNTLVSINQLAVDLRESGELEEAESLFRELVKTNQEVLEPGDFDIGRALSGLAKTLEAAGKLEEALDNAQQCLNHRLEYEGPDSFYTSRNRIDVARVLHKLERDPEALVLLSQLDASLNSESELSDDEQQLLADASALRSAIEGDSA